MSEDEFYARLRAQIRARMKTLGVSQATVAQRLGIDQSSVSRILSGDRKVSSREVTLLADLLQVPVMALLGQEPMPEPRPEPTRLPSGVYLRMAWEQDGVADEFRAEADKRELAERGHECGHQWTISVSDVGHYSVTGDPVHYDHPEPDSLPRSVTVRAHNLSDALRKAAGLPLEVWFEPEED